MKMFILKRCVDMNGNIIGYTIKKNNGKEVFVSTQKALNMQNEIENAIVTKNGRYKAKKGFSIDTVMTKEARNSLLPVVQNKSTRVQSSERVVTTLNEDYYGKQFINICRKIRQLARNGKVAVDRRSHTANAGNNTHLFKLIESCRISVENFIKGYLSVLQPYSLNNFRGNSKGVNLGKKDIWVTDLGYRIKLIIKAEIRNNDEMLIVSFHESNILGKSISGSMREKTFSDKRCAILIESVEDEKVCDMYTVRFIIQRGFIRVSLKERVNYLNRDVALIDYNRIQRKFSNILVNKFETLSDLYYENEKNIQDIGISVENMLSGEFSFSSFGYYDVNSISYLADLFSKHTKPQERLALSDMVLNLVNEVPLERQEEIKNAIKEKYLGGGNELIKAVLERIENHDKHRLQ